MLPWISRPLLSLWSRGRLASFALQRRPPFLVRTGEHRRTHMNLRANFNEAADAQLLSLFWRTSERALVTAYFVLSLIQDDLQTTVDFNYA